MHAGQKNLNITPAIAVAKTIAAGPAKLLNL